MSQSLRFPVTSNQLGPHDAVHLAAGFGEGTGETFRLRMDATDVAAIEELVEGGLVLGVPGRARSLVSGEHLLH